MSQARAPLHRRLPAPSWPWAAVALGLLVLYLPTVYRLATGLWQTETQGHAPLVLAVAAWLLSRRWHEVLALPDPPARWLGWAVAAVGLLSYILGRSQDLPLFEVGSLLWVLAASLLLLRGPAALKLAWFPLFFMFFMVPLPGLLVDAITLPMKTAVSLVSETVLYAIGYPVSRSGVVLQVGQYQLLVADACAGLHTLFVLEAMGLLYLNVVRYASPIRNIGLAILIVPVSFAANVMRVMVLCLITYHLGDEAGQGFLHGFAGIVLFVSALLLITSLDALFRTLFPGAAVAAPVTTTQPDSPMAPRAESAAARRHGSALLAVCVATAVAAWVATPRAGAQAAPPSLAKLIPTEFGGWRTDTAAREGLIVNPEQQAVLETLYSDTLSRTYINGAGQRVMLSLAYGANQSRATQVHRPEVCYPAQGFALGSLSKVTLDGAGAPLPAYRMTASLGARHEFVTYWIRLGDIVVRGAIEQGLARLRYGLAGTLPDGLVFRVSDLGPSDRTEPTTWDAQDQFVAELLRSLPPESRRFLVGASAR